MYLELPAIAYQQGNRQMVVTALDPIGLVKAVQSPDTWSPLGQQAHGNRPQDRAHREGIGKYLEDEANFVLGSVVLYANPKDAVFVADGGQPDEAYIRSGKLRMNYGAQFDVGDGQHRIGAYSDVLVRHQDEDDPIRLRLRKSGQPAVVVIDDNPLNRAQDFTDLQRNSKPPTGSLGMSMDRRQPINRLMVDLIQDPAVAIFGGGDRVEFLKDSPGKFSTKLFSFKSIRYASGTVLIGVKERSTKGWEAAVNKAVEGDAEGVIATLAGMWRGLGKIPAIKRVLDGDATVAELRDGSLLAAAGVQYAIAYAIHLSMEEGASAEHAAELMASINFDRPDRQPSEDKPLTKDETPFAGSLIDRETGAMGSGRPAWEAAGQELWQRIKPAAAAA
jgi:DGQHR domain-containing protein